MSFCQKLEKEKQRNMKISPSHSHGLAKLSHLCLTSKVNDASASSSKNKQQISTEELEENTCMSELSKSLGSPYKNSLTYIKYVPPVDDLNDFKTPEPIKKVSKPRPTRGISVNKQTRTRQSKTAKSSKSKNSIFRITKDNFGQTDINPDHLQMALALSKSTYNLENPVKIKDTKEDFPTFLPREKIATVKTTLEEFGFKSNKPKLYPKVKKDVAEASRKHRNSKFRFVTPVLHIRTPEEREAIITSKISLILNQDLIPPTRERAHDENDLFSDLLKKYNKGNIIFRANRLKLKDTFSFDYHSKGLNLTPTKCKCGYLLRNWEEILGREKSPIRKNVHRSEEHLSKNCVLENRKNVGSKETDIGKEVSVNFQEHCTVKEDKSKVKITLNEFYDKTEVVNNLFVLNREDRNCISPDLFDSEDETDFTPKTPETENAFSQSLLNLSPSKSQGLLRHYNSSKIATDLDNSHEEKLELSKRDLFKDDRGIEHFESYCDDFKYFSQKIYDLVQLSEDEDTEKLYLKSLESNERRIKIDLPQNPLDEVTNKETEVLRNCKSQTEDFIDKAAEEMYTANLKKSESNFDMSPLLIKESSEFVHDGSFRTDAKFSSKAEELDFGCAQVSDSAEALSEMEYLSPVLSRRSSRTGELNSTAMLDVTAYVNQILSQDDEGSIVGSEDVDNKEYRNMSKKFSNSLATEKTHPSSNHVTLGHNIKAGTNYNNCEHSDKLPYNELSLSQGSCSQESIVISDEELNYSSVYSRGTKNGKNVNSLSHDSRSQESIVISDEELNNSGASSRYMKNNEHFYNLSDIEVIGHDNIDNDMDIEEANNVHTALKAKYGNQNVSEPVHNRITELKHRSSLTIKSLTKAALEDSFNDLLEDTRLLETIENEAKAIETQKIKGLPCESPNKENCENKYDNVTPEKHNLQVMPSVLKSNSTPESHLIIKTDNITPMANYDEMDTPKVTKELQQFGLKPLKRQRGVKLLKYLYECTHPLVGPREVEEFSSDDETHRKIKKKKKVSDTTNDTINQTVKQDNCRRDQGGVDIVGDLLLESENLEDLIFERRYSVKIPSCRVPLQIVWHNFVSKNPEIRENILLYEPLQLEVLHSMLKEQSGCKFHIQDLLTFFDKKCITIRTAQAQGGRRTRK